MIGVILICINLGPSGLVGVGILVLNFPVQTFFVRKMFKTRQGQLSIVDQRVRLLQEGQSSSHFPHMSRCTELS